MTGRLCEHMPEGVTFHLVPLHSASAVMRVKTLVVFHHHFGISCRSYLSAIDPSGASAGRMQK